MPLKIERDIYQSITEAFARLKGNDSDVAALRTISDGLHTITDRTVNVTTVRPENKNQTCFVMSVYPDESTINKIITAVLAQETDHMIAEMWKSSDVWTIEIDTRILSNSLGITDSELTALLLHEVGHIIYSSSIPARISRVMKYEMAKYGATRNVLSDSFFSKFLYFPLLNACGMNKSKSSLSEEKKADSYVVYAGYGEDLNSVMDKILKAFKNDTVSPDKQMKALLDFSSQSLKDMESRKHTVVRRNVAKMITSTPSRVCRNMLGKIETGLHGSTDGGSVTESAREEYLTNRICELHQQYLDDLVVTESIFNRIHKMARIDPADIDYIGLESDNIKSNDDKMMIVSYIHNKLDTIDYYIALIDSKNPKYLIPHTRDDLVRMRDTLNKYRVAVINKPLPTVNYDISIAFPQGYEG